MTHQSGNYIVPYNETEAEEKPKHIRCRQCGQRAMENLVVCPHCGRELHPAPPRLLVWGVPVLVVLLFGVAFTSWRDRNPLFWSADRLEQGWVFLTNVGRQIEPRVALDAEPVREPQVVIENSEQQPLVVITAQPAPVLQTEESQQNAAPVELQNADPAPGTPIQSAQGAVEVSPPTETPAPAATDTATATQGATLTVRNTSTPAATASPTASPTAVPTDTPTDAPVDTPTSAPTLATTGAPTATQIVIPTPTPLAGAATRTATPTRAVSLAQLRAAQSPTPHGESANLSVSGASGDATDRTAMRSASADDSQEAGTPSATPTASPTFSPTPSPTPSSTPSSTPSPTPSSTATSAAATFTYSVRAGDTLLAIAQQHDTTINTLMQINGLNENDARVLRPGQELRIPSGSNGPSAGAGRGASASQTYTVQAGDTPFAIATRFGVSVDALLSMNGLSRADATRLRTGQVLVIPDSGQRPAPAATASPSNANPSATATAGEQNEANYRLSAPTLRTPQDGAAIRCSGQNRLVWDPVPFITGTDKYILHLGYLNGVAGDGTEEIVWVLAQEREPLRSFWEMDNELCALAPQELGRKWRWFVQVEDASANPVSPPSAIWSFSWN